MHACVRTRSILLSVRERDRGHDEGLITRRVRTRATIEERRGGGGWGGEGWGTGGKGPAEPIKQVPGLIPPSPLPPSHSPVAAARHSRRPKTRGQHGTRIQSGRRHRPLPRPPEPGVPSPSPSPTTCPPSLSPSRHFVEPFARFARPGLRSVVYHRPFVCPSPRPVQCTAPVGRSPVRRGRVRKSPRGFRRLPDSPE